MKSITVGSATFGSAPGMGFNNARRLLRLAFNNGLKAGVPFPYLKAEGWVMKMISGAVFDLDLRFQTT